MKKNLAPASTTSSTPVKNVIERAHPGRSSQIYRQRAPTPARSPRWEAKALIAVFLVAIALPAVTMMAGIDGGFKLEENRALAVRPKLNFDRAALAKFPAKFEAYFNDQFGMRRRLIYWLNIIKVGGLGVSPSPKVILGKDDWLYYGDIDLDYFRAVRPLRPGQVEAWRRGLEARRDWLAARGIPYLVVFAPSKATIYPEHMPAVYNRVHAETRLDQLITHLKAHSSLTVIDLRQPLLDAKSREQVYYRTDSHWNNRGAYAGYAKIMEALSAWFPQLEVIPRSDFHDVSFSGLGKDLSLILAMRDHYRESYTDIELSRPGRAAPSRQTAEAVVFKNKKETSGPDLVFEQPDSKLPRLVMFRDSFATWLIPFLSEHFQRSVFSWQYTFDPALVERERPDVVIQEMVERQLMDTNLIKEKF